MKISRHNRHCLSRIVGAALLGVTVGAVTPGALAGEDGQGNQTDQSKRVHNEKHRHHNRSNNGVTGTTGSVAAAATTTTAVIGATTSGITSSDTDGDSDGGNGGGTGGTPPKNAFNILMNYELGMHCTGFELSYCCVLPPYNSILAQVVKTEKTQSTPMLLEADPNVGLDGLGRPTVVRDTELDASGNFKKYILKYRNDAQPRNDGRGAAQTSTLISQVEGNSLWMFNTKFDGGVKNLDGSLKTGDKDNASGLILGNGTFGDSNDNFANAWTNHLYIYANSAGNPNLEGANASGGSVDANKIRLGIDVVYADNVGPALHPIGPGVVGNGFDNVLTFSGDTGTVVYTQSKVLENVPITLTSPRIWEALGLPISPFEDSIAFFADPGLVSESSVRPYVKMSAQLFNYDPAATGGVGTAVLDNGTPVTGFGTAPIDIPNCERCHALGDGASINSANNGYPGISAQVQDEFNFWNAYYNIDVAAGDSDWFTRLKGAAISMLSIHDAQHGTSFTANFPATIILPNGNLLGDTSIINGSSNPLNTRLGHQSVICQRCHADNVIAVIKSANVVDGAAGTDVIPSGDLIPPLAQAIHVNHETSVFVDSLGRNASCQGCHPAHRSDGNLASYPITELGLNAFAAGDNRDAAGGCYVGRDAHANRNRNVDCPTPSHLNAIGNWLVTNVSNDTGTDKGIWCTNCHTQLSQEIWKAEDCPDLIHGVCNVDPRGSATLADVATAIGQTTAQVIAWLDPKTTADAFEVWNELEADANIATIEVNASGNPVVTTDPDGDVSVNILSFCTTALCVTDINTNKASYSYIDAANDSGAAVPFSAATDGRDHWLSPGVPHCADCHTAPYTEQSGNISAFLPFNYPRKASMFRYTRGHRDITCQGCHESIHGLYPVTPTIDTTSYAQAASMNTDGTHGPLKCGACHKANTVNGVMAWADQLSYNGTAINTDFDTAVSWMHTFTEEADPRNDVCLNCHTDRRSLVPNGSTLFTTPAPKGWLQHAELGRVTRDIMDQVEIAQVGNVTGDPAVVDPLTTVCVGCHVDRSALVSCTNTLWKQHIPKGRVARKVWESVSTTQAGSTCGF